MSLHIHSPPQNPLFQGDFHSGQFMVDLEGLGPNFSQCAPRATLTVEPPRFPGYQLNAAQEKEVLLRFFDDIHSAIPLFQKDEFFKLYDEGMICYNLVTTLNAVTAKILGPISFWQSENVDLCINSLLTATAYENDSASSRTSLDQFRQECLLAYYDFHQFPGAPAWMRISRLTRKAYAMGLNQIENPDLCIAYDVELATEEEIENWRYAWWCVYSLDSYSNMSLGTPFIVDIESINTALIRRSFSDDHVPMIPKLFLPDDVDELWRTAQEVVLNPCEREFNIYLLTTMMLRHAGNILRLKATQKQAQKKTALLKNALASFRLALPPRYLNPTRNALAAESGIDHHIRLSNILHLHMSRLIISLPHDIAANEAEWSDCWQQSLEACQDIVLVVEQWDNQFSSRVDPAICLIVFIALWVINLHRRCISDMTSPLLTSLIQAETILLLFLEQFSRMWSLPRILIQLFKNSPTERALKHTDVDRLVHQIKMPFHPKTIQRTCAINFTNPCPVEQFEMIANPADIWPQYPGPGFFYHYSA